MPPERSDKELRAALQIERDARKKAETLAKSNTAAAQRLAEIEESQKTEQQKLTDRAAEAERRAAEAEARWAKAEVAAAKGLPAGLALRLTGTTREELEADADILLQQIQSTKPPTKPPLPPADAVAGSNAGGGKAREPADIFAAMLKGGA
ncbi:MAG: hypothetical protein WCF04_11550 [Candidatus Nanopelagicales bacterium]